MIYAEYIERDRFMPIEIFRHLGDQSAWTAPEDKMVGSFGRTMRLGPMPSYLAFWQCKGMDRMDEWEAHFRSPAGLTDAHELATHRAIHLQHGGCYDELVVNAKADRQALFIIEYFPVPSSVDSDDAVKHFKKRAKAASAKLDFLLRRIGRLGPEPSGLAVWSFPDYETLEPFERARDDADPFRPDRVGVYRWFGREVL